MSSSPSLSSRLALVPLLTASALLAGCFSNKIPTPKYYEQAAFQGVGGDDATVDFDLHVSPAPQSPTPSVAQLPEKALAALIEVYGHDQELKKQLPAVLASPLKGASSSSWFDDSLVRFKKRFTFTISPRDFHPADRLYSATLTARAPKGWQFTGWSGFQAKDRTVNLAKVEASLRQKYNASLKLAPPQIAELTEASLGGERERTDSVERQLDFEVVEFLPRLDDQTAELTLNAPFPQINVAGSYSVDIAFGYRNPAVQRVVVFSFDKDSKLTDHRLVKLLYVPNLTARCLESPVPDQALEEVTLSYVERRVFAPGVPADQTGASTADEGDDVATYRKRTITAKSEPKDQSMPWETGGIPLLHSDEVEALVVIALYDEAPIFLYDSYAHQRPEDAQCLIFRNGSEAQEFAAWLRSDPVHRVSGNENGHSWKLQIDRAEQRIDLDGAELKKKLEGRDSPLVFQAILLNNPQQVERLGGMGCF